MYKTSTVNKLADAPPSSASPTSTPASAPVGSCFEALYRKKSTKKHKTWEGDAIAYPKGNIYIIKCDARTIAAVTADKVYQGAEFTHGPYEFEIGATRQAPAASPSVVHPQQSPVASPASSPLRPQPSQSTTSGASLASLLAGKAPVKAYTTLSSLKGSNPTQPVATTASRTASTTASIDVSAEPIQEAQMPISKRILEEYGKQKTPKKRTTKAASVPVKPKTSKTAQSLNTLQANIDMLKATPVPRQSSTTAKEWRISPKIADVLRPHQSEAVEFLYQCLSGQRHCYGNGALLADDMGLGKTLTSIALIYSMLQAELVSTVLVACPATLIKNWKAEFRKWLPKEAIGVFAYVPGEDLKLFCKPGLRRTYSVMIAGYERIRSISDQIKQEMGEFDLVVCDEGHRLKSSESKTWSALIDISGPKRVILTGTPVQNNLEEFWSMAEYINPGIFGNKISKFTREFSGPIQASRATDASEEAKELGQQKMKELGDTTNQFCLRRDQKVLENHISVPKREFLLFVKPLQEQIYAYEAELEATHFWDPAAKGGAQSLQLINTLRKISTSSDLLKPKSLKGSFAQQLESMDPLNGSSKMILLKKMLQKLYDETDEKVVIVSGSTETLQLAQQLCGKYNMSWVRLDGSTPQNKRQPMVDLFNKSNKQRAFAFLLSAKCGGVGLNLIGGSRLIMLDCDWNPSVDLQAMARIHRDGQTRPTFIYRILSTGMIDEKILQRQITKQGVSDSLFDMEDASNNKFTPQQLREIFAFKLCLKCDTLDQGIALDYSEPSETEPIVQVGVDGGLISCILEK